MRPGNERVDFTSGRIWTASSSLLDCTAPDSSAAHPSSGETCRVPTYAAQVPSTMSDPITIRNLTPRPLTLKLIERYEAPSSKPSPSNAGFSSFTSNFTAFLGGAAPAPAAPTATQLSEKVQSFAKQDVDLRLAPFTTHLTEIPLTVRASHEILRLTFHDDDGGRWRVDAPTLSPASQMLTPLTPDPRHAYTAIYLAAGAFLAIYESTELGSWMRAFHDATPLAALSIPGTHNSATCFKALPSVRCQAVSPREQLENGVRFFDIRVQPGRVEDAQDASLTLVHGVFPISLTGPKKFQALLEVVYEFLRQHPSETVIFSLKREGVGATTDQQLAQILHDHYTTDASRWYTEPRVPRLGEARGKIVLLRRFALADALKTAHGGRGWALDAANWSHSTPDCTRGDVRVQDFCDVLEPETIERKIELCCAHFERAAAVVCPLPGVATDVARPAVPPGPLYLNFLSASNFWKVECWPEKIAARLNPAITAFLCMKHDVGDKGVEGPGEAFAGDGGVGIVVCDWVGKDGDWDLVRCIVALQRLVPAHRWWSRCRNVILSCLFGASVSIMAMSVALETVCDWKASSNCFGGEDPGDAGDKYGIVQNGDVCSTSKDE
nr:1-phosphatidylinositol phosphodiesterase [Quercus suber]